MYLRLYVVYKCVDMFISNISEFIQQMYIFILLK